MGQAAREESYRHRRGLITQRTWQRNYFKQVLNPLRGFFCLASFLFFFFLFDGWGVGVAFQLLSPTLQIITCLHGRAVKHSRDEGKFLNTFFQTHITPTSNTVEC